MSRMIECPSYAFVLDDYPNFCISYCGENLVQYEISSTRCLGSTLYPRTSYELIESYQKGFFQSEQKCSPDFECAECYGYFCIKCADGYEMVNNECMPKCDEPCVGDAVCVPGGVCAKCPRYFRALDEQCVPNYVELCKSKKYFQQNSLCRCIGAESGLKCDEVCVSPLINSKFGCASETCLQPIQCFGRSTQGCVRSPIGYICLCNIGYTGVDCEKCADGYLPDTGGTLCSNACSGIEHCATCNLGVCVQCAIGYSSAIIEGISQCVRSPVCENCEECNEGVCVLCRKGLVPVGNHCVHFYRYYGCDEWDELGWCKKCKPNYNLNNRVCSHYSSVWRSVGEVFVFLAAVIWTISFIWYYKRMEKMKRIFLERVGAKKALLRLKK